MTFSATAMRRFCVAAAGTLVLGSAPQPARAATTIEDLAREIAKLKAENKAMRGEIADLRDKTVRTPAKARTVARTPVAPAAAPAPARFDVPADATPVLVRADKRVQFGAITITPGGFLAAENVFRSRTTQSEVISDFRATPFGNNPLSRTNESRLSARQTRVSLLAEGLITPTFAASGYLEIDFLGAAQNGNSIEVNGYQARIRNLYVALDEESYGLHLLAGQNWSLTTLNSKGITPRNEVIPSTIDGQFVPGFNWTRQAQVRLTKDFGQRLWASLSAEEAQTTFAGGCTTAGASGGLTPPGANAGIAGITSITCGGPGTGGGFSALTNYSLNRLPDVVGKVAYEARLADRDVHLEAYGLYRSFYDRVSYTGGTSAAQTTNGYGIGGGIVVPVVPKQLDVQLSGLVGRGIGRYGSAQLADTTFNPDGSLKPTREVSVLGGATWHATPAIDVYGFAGVETIFSSYFQNPDGTFVGLGSPALAAANAGCAIEGSTLCASAPGNSRQIWQVTGGMWDKIYKGNFGEVRAGVQYSYTQRAIFSAPGFGSPKTDNHTVMTSLRYFPFK